MDFEHASSVTGYDSMSFLRRKKQIKRLLESPYCKALLPWNEWGKQTLLHSIDSPIIRGKIHVVPPAIVAPELRMKVPHEKITLVFIGSANLPKDFYHKGGKAVFKIYKELKKNYDIRHVVRCAIPEELSAWVHEFRSDPDIEIIDEMYSRDRVYDLLARCDIFISPTITTPILIYLDSMAQQVPVVTTSAWANAELVEHGKTGIVVEKPIIGYYEKDMLPKVAPHWNEVKTFDEDDAFIKRFAAGVAKLIENPDLIEKYGKAGREEVVNGKFSISRRNKLLKEIFDKATGAEKDVLQGPERSMLS
jgi:glycosyltransferase involved in cell wall biosynthesis